MAAACLVLALPAGRCLSTAALLGLEGGEVAVGEVWGGRAAFPLIVQRLAAYNFAGTACLILICAAGGSESYPGD